MLDIKKLIEETFQKVKTTLTLEIASDTPAVLNTVSGYVADTEKRFAHLAEGALSSELSYKEVVGFLQEEPEIMKNQFLSIVGIIGTDIDQLAAKTVFILEEALKEGINQAQAK